MQNIKYKIGVIIETIDVDLDEVVELEDVFDFLTVFDIIYIYIYINI